MINDDEIAELLKLASLSKEFPEASDKVAETLLSSGVECSQESTDRIRKRFTEKLFLQNFPQPIKAPDSKFTFGRFLEAVREELRLATSDVSNALESNEESVVKLEKGQTQPWQCEPSYIAKVMQLFRLHIDSVKQLVNTSATVDNIRGLGSVSARSKGSKMTRSRGDSTARALESYLAKNASPSKPSTEIAQWLKDLELVLEKSELNDLNN